MKCGLALVRRPAAAGSAASARQDEGESRAAARSGRADRRRQEGEQQCAPSLGSRFHAITELNLATLCLSWSTPGNAGTEKIVRYVPRRTGCSTGDTTQGRMAWRAMAPLGCRSDLPSRCQTNGLHPLGSSINSLLRSLRKIRYATVAQQPDFRVCKEKPNLGIVSRRGHHSRRTINEHGSLAAPVYERRQRGYCRYDARRARLRRVEGGPRDVHPAVQARQH